MGNEQKLNPETQNDAAHSISECKANKHAFEIILTHYIDPKNPVAFLGEGRCPRQIRWCSMCGALSLDLWFNSSSQRKESGYSSISIRIPEISE
jgi:hypothetical protein